VFLLAGIETVRIEPGNTAFTPFDFASYPWSHSLVMVCAWGLLAALLYRATRRDGRGAIAVFALVVSHWVLDFATHRPDMPLSPWSSVKAGLGLWRSVPATLAVESAMFAAGIAIYLRATRARDRTGLWAFVALVLFLFVSYLGAAFGPPPPDVRTLAWGGLLLSLPPLSRRWLA